MDSVIMKLSGNLGERHRCFNALLFEAYLQQNTYLPVPHHPKEAALDRLFKIDLASKQRNVDFIIHTLKDDDLLYVNRALKSLWLLEPQYCNIINPIFLEHELYPHMILPAVNKMRHWIQMHLRDQQRCKEFHQFYKERDFDIAVRFLWHCSNEYVLVEISDILEKITPKLLKRLSEKVPQITKIYYDRLKHSQALLKYYQANDTKFFANMKYLLKTDPNIFFHVLENFFVPQKFRSLSGAVTQYIMKQHTSRFLWKPELYTAWFFDVASLARCLSSEEIKELVLKLARAEYLKSWFSYKTVEPLIKRINKEERTAFKTFVFVDKAFGPTVKEWPYPVPDPPVYTVPQTDLFDDVQLEEYRNYDNELDDSDLYDEYCRRKKVNRKTFLDDLFDKYRFYPFDETFLELRKQIKAEGSAENRMFMLLVLVSKTGGRTEDVVSLMDLLSQHRNEPVQIRAAIVRSLVKRACVWRLPSEHWARVLEWGHGLGLDGSPSEANCYEGLHAVLIRNMLAGVNPSEVVWKSFLTYFNTLHEYLFTADERRCIRIRLPTLLIANIQSEPDDSKFNLLNHLLDTLKAYNVRFDDFPGVVEAVVAVFKHRRERPYFMQREIANMLKRLYDAEVGRKRLIREYFEIRQTDASYVNALRHDVSILNDIQKFEQLTDRKYLKHDQFFRKLALYFMEEDGLGERYRAVLAGRATATYVETPFTRNRRCGDDGPNFFNRCGRQILAMPLAALSGPTFISLLETLDKGPPKSNRRQNAAALRSNAHIVRPAFDLESFGWRNAGVKAVANRVATCRYRDVERCLRECLTWRRTLRLALVPAKRLNKERDIFEVLASQRPGAALQAALRYFYRMRDSCDLGIWEMVKLHILKANTRQLSFHIGFIKSAPEVIKAEYCFLVYKVSKNYNEHFQRQALLEIPSVLPGLNEQYIFDTIDGFLCEYFKDCLTVKEKIKITHEKNIPYYIREHKAESNKRCIILYIEIIAKFLVLNTSEEMLEESYKTVASPFLHRLELFWKQISPKDVPTEKYLDSFLYYLRYNKAYFDVKYVSCLPVLERITEWMQRFLPIEKWFEKYVKLNLTKIYFKAVRHCINQNPELLSEFKKQECSYMLGTTFGNFVSNEIEELSVKYFSSITELYGSVIVDYFNEYLYRQNDECFERFTVAVVNALATNNSTSCVLSKHIFTAFESRLKSEHVNYIVKLFNESGVKVLRVEMLGPLPVYDNCFRLPVPPPGVNQSIPRKRKFPRRGGKRSKRFAAYY